MRWFFVVLCLGYDAISGQKFKRMGDAGGILYNKTQL